jgi:hypothetical protein
VFFLTLATLIVVDRVSSVVLALLRGTETLNVWQSVFLPMFVVFGVVSLWQGEKWLRQLVAAWALIHGGAIFILIGAVMYRMAAVTPPEQSGFFLSISATLFGFPLFLQQRRRLGIHGVGRLQAFWRA